MATGILIPLMQRRKKQEPVPHKLITDYFLDRLKKVIKQLVYVRVDVVTGRQLKAARALVGWKQTDLPRKPV